MRLPVWAWVLSFGARCVTFVLGFLGWCVFADALSGHVVTVSPEWARSCFRVAGVVALVIALVALAVVAVAPIDKGAAK